MARYLLDTNHLSPLVTLSHPLRRRVHTSIESGDSFAIATPTIAEFLFGIRLLPRAAENLAEWERIRTDFFYHAIDIADAEMASSLQASLRQRGWQLETVDALIAAVALRNDLVLLTTDGDYRAIAGLITENWLVSVA
jgi:tRNA(fMet)-specific endonuclease VapC